jgi:transposase
MSLKRRQFTREFKLTVIREVESGKSQAEIARQYQVNQSTIRQWLSRYGRNPGSLLDPRGSSTKEIARVAEMERLIGRLSLENDILKKALQRLEARRR